MKFSIPFAASVGTSFLLTLGLAAPLDPGNHTAIHTTSPTAASTTTTTVTIVFDGRPAAVSDWRPSHPHALNPLSTPTTSPNATILFDGRSPRRVWKPSHPDQTKPLSTPTTSASATTLLAARSPRMVWFTFNPDPTKPLSTPTSSPNPTISLEAQSPWNTSRSSVPSHSKPHFDVIFANTTVALSKHSSTKTIPQVSGLPVPPALAPILVPVTQITVTHTTATSSSLSSSTFSTSTTPKPTTSYPCTTRVPKFKSWGPRTRDVCYNLASVVTETQYIKCDDLCKVEHYWLEAGRGGQVRCKTWLPGTFTATTTVCTTDAAATPTGA